MAINWFRKKENKEETAITPAEELEQVANSDPEIVSDLEGEIEVKSEEEEEEPVDTGDPPLQAEVNDASESDAKPGFLKGAWAATKKLALTPVDPFFESMVAGLERTRKNLLGQISSVFRLHKKVDEDFWQELEDTLITSDVGNSATDRIMEELKAYAHEHNVAEPAGLTSRIREVITEILLTDQDKRVLNIEPGRVNVILMVGVNGAGKTTSTAKLTYYFKEQGFSVLLAAADTFRAAAIEQLQSWAGRLDVPLIKHKEGSDPAAVVYDACSAALARKSDILIIDTAGRLQNKSNLMKELEKIHRVIDREIPEAPHEVLLVLDATTGQNALSQAKQFSSVTPITGLVMCKLDGSAKGGIMVAVAQEFGIPVKFIGVGESKDDLKPFVPELFVNALFGESEFRSTSK